MADEPNKRMDEMLKAYAENRRQDPAASVELHPATRQMLQAEVARTYKQAPRASFVHRIIMLWPRLAFAATCLLVTLTVVLIVMPGKITKMEMAQRKLAEEETLGRDSRMTDKESADAFANSSLADSPAPASSTAPIAPGSPPPAPTVDRLAKRNETDELKAKSENLAEARLDSSSRAVSLKREEAVQKN